MAFLVMQNLTKRKKSASRCSTVFWGVNSLTLQSTWSWIPDRTQNLCNKDHFSDCELELTPKSFSGFLSNAPTPALSHAQGVAGRKDSRAPSEGTVVSRLRQKSMF